MNDFAEAGKKTVYNFLKMQIDINCSDADLFVDGAGLDPESSKYPVLWHEYVHYLQNVTTTIGSRIWLNWIAVLIRFSETCSQRDPLPVPLNCDGANPFSGELLAYMGKLGQLMALKTPLDEAPPSTVESFTPYLDPKDDSHAYLCIEDSGSRVGVPLYGNAFVEGMAQAVQWLAAGHGEWSDDFLVGKRLDQDHAYYHAVLRYFRHHLENVNPCVPTVLVSHAALQTTQPAALFFILHEKGMAKWNNPECWRVFQQQAPSLKSVKRGIASGLEELDGFLSRNRAKAGTDFYEMTQFLAELMKSALVAYQSTPDVFASLLNPTPEGLAALAGRFHFPALYTNDIKSGWSLSLPEPLKKLCAVNASMRDLAFGMHDNGLTEECPLLKKQYCTFRKSKKTYCHTTRLQFEEVGGETCAMGKAASLLSIWNKQLRRLV